MGKDLHYSIIKFFRDRMREHSKVSNYSVIRDDNEILYQIERSGVLPDIVIHLSDSYIYNLHDFLSKPSILAPGDFILVSRPEAKYTGEVMQEAQRNKIGIGKLRELLSALHYDLSTDKGYQIYRIKNNESDDD